MVTRTHMGPSALHEQVGAAAVSPDTKPIQREHKTGCGGRRVAVAVGRIAMLASHKAKHGPEPMHGGALLTPGAARWVASKHVFPRPAVLGECTWLTTPGGWTARTSISGREALRLAAHSGQWGRGIQGRQWTDSSVRADARHPGRVERRIWVSARSNAVQRVQGAAAAVRRW